MVVMERTVEIGAPLERVFAFVTDFRNHQRVVPPQVHAETLDAGDIPMRLGTVVGLRVRYAGARWVLAAGVVAFDPPGSQQPGKAHFRHAQETGPFAVWSHDHWFASTTARRTALTDRLSFASPFGPIGKLFERLFLARYMRRLLEYIQTEEKRLLEAGDGNMQADLD